MVSEEGAENGKVDVCVCEQQEASVDERAKKKKEEYNVM